MIEIKLLEGRKVIYWSMRNIVVMLFLALIFAPSILAKSMDIPEADGDYQDPENKNQRVRVFVHKVKESATEILACVDENSDAVVGATGWKLPGTVTYQLNVSTVPASVGAGNWPEIAKRSFEVWQNSVGNKVQFVRGQDTKLNRQSGDGQNILAWGRTSGNALAVTYTRYNTVTKQVVDVDTIMNQKYSWTWSDNTCGVVNTYDSQNILTHELGHWMGLNDHYTSEYMENTMFGYGAKAEVKKNTLTTGDVVGVGVIYQ